jgi:uncharacterized alkaline shock family protein YloU
MTNLAGEVKIADDVLANIASTAVLEAEGVAGMAGQFTGEFAGMLRKKQAKGVRLQVEEGQGTIKVSVDIMIKSGEKIQNVALDVQKKIKDAMETMTGYEANEVNVQVIGLVV